MFTSRFVYAVGKESPPGSPGNSVGSSGTSGFLHPHVGSPNSSISGNTTTTSASATTTTTSTSPGITSGAHGAALASHQHSAAPPSSSGGSPSSNGTTTQFTRDECLVLFEKNGGHNIPMECQDVLNIGARTGLLARRRSSVARTWNPKDGHGSRALASDNPGVVGTTVDTATGSKDSIGEVFLAHKTPEEIAKINSLVIRTASRGGKVRLPVDQTAVDREKKSELVRRESRKLERQNSRSSRNHTSVG